MLIAEKTQDRGYWRALEFPDSISHGLRGEYSHTLTEEFLDREIKLGL